MQIIIRSLIAALVTLLLVDCSKSASSIAADDVYLQCKGDISVFRDSGGLQTEGNQEIAAHIKRGKINFSGNSLLLGENIQICTPSADQPTFDNESCQGQSRTDPKRKYGTYNKVTGVLDLTNQVSDSNVAFIEGRFKCARAEPLLK